MPLETSVICLDTSEWMRNGDYTPTRLGAQYDSVTTMCACKVNQNPENTVGLISYSSKGVRLLTAPTEDQGKLFAVLTELKAEGGCAVTQAIKTAMLALKHRKNKNGGQRIVVFVGSPVADASSAESNSELKALGTQLRRNNIALDLIGIGENENNAAAFQVLIDAANKDGNSRLMMVPAGVLPSEMLSTSPIMMGDLVDAGGAGVGGAGGAGGAGAGAAGGGFANFGGIDPSMDPELAEAMRLSMEEARAAQQREEAVATAASTSSTSSSSSAAAPAPSGGTGGVVAANSMAVDGDLTDEDALLQQALALSMNEANAASSSSSSSATAATSTPASAAPAASPVAPGAPASAAAPSSSSSSSSSSAAPAAGGAASGGGFSNPDFIQSVLAGMEGVDMSDPELQAAIAAALGGSGSGETKEGEKKDGEGK